MTDLNDVDKIPVVKIAKARETAFRWGFERFDGTDVPAEEFDLEGFHQSAEYVNHTLPDLRALAGFADWTGKGTYTGDRPVAVIPAGDEDDHPATAEVVESANHIMEELLEYWENGAFEGATTE